MERQTLQMRYTNKRQLRSISIICHRLNVMRQSMMFFLSNLLTYLQVIYYSYIYIYF